MHIPSLKEPGTSHLLDCHKEDYELQLMSGLFPRAVFSFLGGKGKGVAWSHQPRRMMEVLLCLSGTFLESSIRQRQAPTQAGGAESSAHPQPSSSARLQYQGVPETYTERCSFPCPSQRHSLGFGECATSLGQWKHLTGQHLLRQEHQG